MSYVAIDIGGSAIKAGVVNEKGEVRFKTSIPTPMCSYEKLLETLSKIVDWAKSKSDIKGIALSQPCVTNAKSAEALSEGALIYIKNTNPAKDLGQKFNLPYAAENDGNCAALAEVWVGSGQQADSLALVVCGTGVGGAVVVDKKIHAGHRNFAGEFGMFVTGFTPDGTPVLWSSNGSTLALVQEYARMTGKDSTQLNGKAIFELEAEGDEIAYKCIDQFFKTFAVGLHNIQHAYDPQLILIGGAISERKDFVDRIERALDWLYKPLTGLMSRPNVATCACGADANLIGAVYHLLTHSKNYS